VVLGCDLDGEAGHEVVHPPHPEPLDRLRREPLVDGGPFGRVQVGGRRDDREHLVLRQLPGGEQLPHVIEPEVQVPRQVQPAASLERRHPARHATSATIFRSTRSGSKSLTEVSAAARNNANSRIADAFCAAARFSAICASAMASRNSRSRAERESTMCSILA
jgi:hypothetical protein